VVVSTGAFCGSDGWRLDALGMILLLRAQFWIASLDHFKSHCQSRRGNEVASRHNGIPREYKDCLIVGGQSGNANFTVVNECGRLPRLE
jgi:hypothetical protein